jgi:hypothetical protein
MNWTMSRRVAFPVRVGGAVEGSGTVLRTGMSKNNE